MPLDRAIEYAQALGGEEIATTTATVAAGADARSSPLSVREQEVAVLVARGMTNRQIAAELVIAERTAGSHVAHILDKLGFTTRSQIATWVTERGLAKPAGAT